MNTPTELQIGTELVNIEIHFSSKWYTISKVVRFTPTTAILENGTIIYRNGDVRVDYVSSEKYTSWKKKGDVWSRWQLVTYEIRREIALQNKEHKIKKWFNNFTQKPTIEDMEKVYNLFNQAK